ncbi:MAG: NeuD/PglB/VioB family sugar acetyltransferase [Chitinophagaceae bacterium]|nr:NeuD/PglB/VioB family sugar acetyltransferase [Chitinophagaceae bacterium]
MSKIVDIVVSKETVSDDSYKVTSLLFKNGASVKKGDLIGSFETSKADVDIESPVSGYVFYNCSEGGLVTVGSLFAAIAETDTLPASYFEENAPKQVPPSVQDTPHFPDNVRVSRPAERLIREHNIDILAFQGKSIIEKKDVEEYIYNKEKGRDTGSQVQETRKIAPSCRVVVIGGGNHSKVCIDILRQMNIWEIAGIVYTRKSPGKDVLGYPVIGGLENLESIYREVASNAVIGIGGLEDPQERADLFQKLKLTGFAIPNIIHPKAIVEPSVRMGEGNQVFGGGNIGSCCKIGSNCIINSNSIVSHDSMLGDNVHITPGAIIAGTVRIGDNSIIGMGVTVYYNCTIGKNVTINNGHNIFKDVPDNTKIR